MPEPERSIPNEQNITRTQSRFETKSATCRLGDTNNAPVCQDYVALSWLPSVTQLDIGGRQTDENMKMRFNRQMYALLKYHFRSAV